MGGAGAGHDIEQVFSYLRTLVHGPRPGHGPEERAFQPD